METQDFNKELLDYLYGEMTSNDKKEFERKLQEDESLQREYEVMVSVRDELDSLKDKEVMEPFSAWNKSKSSGWFGTGQRRRIVVFRPVTAVAASLLIFMLLGYLTNFSVSINDKGLQLGFRNTQETEKRHYLSEADVKSFLSLEVQKNNEIWLARLASNEKSYDAKIASLESNIVKISETKQGNSISNEDLQNFFTRAENKNTDMMKEYLKMTSAQQQDYFKAMFTQFNNFYQQQRDDDLTFIQTSLVEMKQNQNLQKQETDYAIASLYTSVSKKRKLIEGD